MANPLSRISLTQRLTIRYVISMDRSGKVSCSFDSSSAKTLEMMLFFGILLVRLRLPLLEVRSRVPRRERDDPFAGGPSVWDREMLPLCVLFEPMVMLLLVGLLNCSRRFFALETRRTADMME